MEEKEEIDVCSICLEAPNIPSELSGCIHIFCYACIYEWSKSSNTCPLCKVRFRSINKIEYTKKRKSYSGRAQKTSVRKRTKEVTVVPNRDLTQPHGLMLFNLSFESVSDIAENLLAIRRLLFPNQDQMNHQRTRRTYTVIDGVVDLTSEPVIEIVDSENENAHENEDHGIEVDLSEQHAEPIIIDLTD